MADSHAKNHDYHLVDPSPWPVTASVAAFVTAIGAIVWMRSLGGGSGLFGMHGPWVFALGFAGLSLTAYLWWRDVIIEAHKGDHTPVVQLHLRYGMIMFIASEVMFFIAWFWAYFDASLFPGAGGQVTNIPETVGLVARQELTGGHWPPSPATISRRPSIRGACRWSIRSSCCSRAAPSPGRTMRC